MYNFDKLLDRHNTNSTKWDTLERLYGSKDVIPMWIADMDFECLPELVEAVTKRASHPTYGYFFPPEGYYQSIIDWNKKRNDFDIAKGDIVPVPGCVAATTFAIWALTNVGEKVLLHTPIYHPFYASIRDSGRQIVTSDLVQDENLKYNINWEDTEEKLKDPKCTMMILCSPHNPAGRIWTREELEKLVDLCAKHNVKIFSDEIHSDLILNGKHIPYLAVNEKAKEIGFMVAAPSKTFNIAGLKSSFFVVQNDAMMAKLKNFYNIFHIGVDLLATLATEAAYTYGGQWVDELCVYLRKNAEFVVDYCNKNTKIKAFVPEATFLMFLDFSAYGLSHEEIVEKCKKAGVGMNEGSMFGEKGKMHMRLNIGTPKHVIEEELNRLHNEFDK